jgi:hypothetical protein
VEGRPVWDAMFLRWDDRDGGTWTNEEPCVLRSSLQCGDQWRELTDVLREIVCEGSGLWFVIEDVLQILIFPSGKLLPVASRSGFQGHHAIAYTKYHFGPETESNKRGG